MHKLSNQRKSKVAYLGTTTWMVWALVATTARRMVCEEGPKKSSSYKFSPTPTRSMRILCKNSNANKLNANIKKLSIQIYKIIRIFWELQYIPGL
jgi:hypothetical protein